MLGLGMTGYEHGHNSHGSGRSHVPAAQLPLAQPASLAHG
jgi:hypothetical protein